MTSLVVTRRPLETLSMNNQSERRTSKRLAGRSLVATPGGDVVGLLPHTMMLTRMIAATTFEEDDGFIFERKSKRAKTDEAEPEKKGRGRPAKAKDSGTNTAATRAATSTSTTATKRSARQKASADAPQDVSPLKVTKKNTRRGARLSPEPETEEPKTNGASRSQGRGKGKPTRGPREWEESPPGPPVESSKIALPMSDTPIINRNKAMRKKGSTNRRSSLGTRGRRASSLIDSGQSAIPHRDVNAGEFYKHIASGLIEPRRMKQLLTWCGERALSEKPPHGTANSNAILGGMGINGFDVGGLQIADFYLARAIQDQLLKDFGSREEFSNWFGRDDQPANAPVYLQPNPKNTELNEKMATLEEKIQRYGPLTFATSWLFLT